MGLAVYPEESVLVCDCDEAEIELLCFVEVKGTEELDILKRALNSGWGKRVHAGKELDLCPSHLRQYDDRKPPATKAPDPVMSHLKSLDGPSEADMLEVADL